MNDIEPPELIQSLMNPAVYGHPVDHVELIETHISWVFLAGDYVYKLKKPVDLGFLDFSTLEKRRYFCEEELRLNKRLAPDIYDSVIKITGTPGQPQIDGTGEAIEYAVKMNPFPQEAQLDHVLQRDELDNHKIDALAAMVAQFHQQTDTANNEMPYGDSEHIVAPVRENFSQIRERIDDPGYLESLEYLEKWSEESFAALKGLLDSRKSEGFIRECHGDMHLRNLAWHNERALAFDCIEFDPNLRWIDVISDIAFLIMDLQDRNEARKAQRFLNQYLEITGDYSGLKLLPFYLTYRALVRAKVAAIRVEQTRTDPQENDAATREFAEYLELARKTTLSKPARIILTRGLSGSGKTTCAQELLEQLEAIRIRSDIERKRLFGLRPDEDGSSAVGAGIYSKDASKKTYAKLLELAEAILDAGYPVIVDAVFMTGEQRKPFYDLACKKGIPYVVLEFQASHETLRKRILARKGDASDADIKVLEHQIAAWEEFSEEEEKHAIMIDTESDIDIPALTQEISSRSG